MKHELPSNIGRICAVVGESHSHRLDGIELKCDGETYSAVTCDNVMIASVSGHIPNGEKCDPQRSVVSADELRQCLGKCRRDGVEVEFGVKETVITCRSTRSSAEVQLLNFDGKFPKCDDFLNPKTEPMLRIHVDPRFLIQLLDVASHYADWDDVVLEFRGSAEPIHIKTEGDDQQFIGVLMPRVPEDLAKVIRSKEVTCPST